MNWQTPPTELNLFHNEVHIWCVNLNIPESQIEQLAKLLCEEEITRANRFHFPHHRQRFIVARSTLRIILGRYLKIEPSNIQFQYTPKGKPSIKGDEGLNFNMSHSENMALYGITRDRLIGVDIEYLRPMEDAAQLAKRFFCQSEYEVISPLPPGEREKVFFRAWTAKEAFLKATGAGIGGGLEGVEVDLTCEDTIRFLRLKEPEYTVSDWSLLSLIPADEYRGAVVVQGDLSMISQYRLNMTFKFEEQKDHHF